MATLRFRITGSSESRDQLIAQLEGLDQIASIQEIGDMMPAMNDDDSSSAGLAENTSADVYAFEIEIDGADNVDLVRRVAEVEARDAGLVLEIVEDF